MMGQTTETSSNHDDAEMTAGVVRIFCQLCATAVAHSFFEAVIFPLAIGRSGQYKTIGNKSNDF